MIYLTSDTAIARRTLCELERKHDAAVIYMRQPGGTVWHVVRGDVEAALRQLDVITAQRGNYAGTVLHQIEIGPAVHLLRSHARGWQYRYSADDGGQVPPTVDDLFNALRGDPWRSDGDCPEIPE